jgi:hypothetical protein
MEEKTKPSETYTTSTITYILDENNGSSNGIFNETKTMGGRWGYHTKSNIIIINVNVGTRVNVNV